MTLVISGASWAFVQTKNQVIISETSVHAVYAFS